MVPYTAVIHRHLALGILQISRTQFPFMPVEALTIHKLRDGTYDNVKLEYYKDLCCMLHTRVPSLPLV